MLFNGVEVITGVGLGLGKGISVGCVRGFRMGAGINLGNGL